MTRRRGVELAGRLGLVGAVLGAALAAPSTAAGGGPVAPLGRVHRAADCAALDHGFRPTSVTMPGIVPATPVLAVGRDRHGTPLTPPLTDAGRWQLAWDSTSRILPGGPRGVVRLNAHTYPYDGSAGTALGNRLLERLHRGDRLIVAGAEGERLCYRVTRRVQRRAEQPLLAYYSDSGRSRLAILVCSGRRRGPGDWSHRTIWFARPVH